MTLHKEDFARLMPEVAQALLGEPNKRLSNKRELRFGAKGSVAVDLKSGVWVDHSMSPGDPGGGGGTLDLIQRETGLTGQARVGWLMDHGYLPDDRNGAAPNGHARGNGHAEEEAPPWEEEERGGPAGVPAGFFEARTFDYIGPSGDLIFQVVRFEPTDRGAGKEKTFRQRRPNGRGGWIYSTRDIEKVPYRLTELIEDVGIGATVFVVEGEKCVDALREQGLAATTNAGGAGHWTEDLNRYLTGANVVVIPDNDPQATNKQTGAPRFHEDGRPVYAGRDHALAVARSLSGVAASVRVLELGGKPQPPLPGPDLGPKEDVFDWLAKGHTGDELLALGRAVPVWTPDYDWTSKFAAIPWPEIDRKGVEYDYLIKGWITRYERAMLVGASQSGKSFLALHAAFAIARGTDFFGCRTRRGLVLYQAGEGRLGLKKRVRAYREHFGLKTTDDVPFVLLPKTIDLFASDEDVGRLVEEAAHWQRVYANHPLELMVIDTYSAATPGSNENASEDVSKILKRADTLSQSLGCAVLIVHHKNAAGSRPRGHSSVFANLDSVIDCAIEEGMRDAGEPYTDAETGETRYRRRPIRSAELTKQKDEEDGKRIRFVLKSVQIGIDDDRDPITSCVCLPPFINASTDAEKVKVDYGKKLTASEHMLLRAIHLAIEVAGQPAPATLQLPPHVTVVDWKHVMKQYRALSFEEASDGEDPKKMDGRIKMAVKRAGEALIRENIIMRERPWVWLTGRRVKGFAPPRVERPSLVVVGGTDAGPSSPTGDPETDAPF